jgi:CelD/BcsL family acetyltransferase involved in cellulose biosynthesis
MIYAVDPLEDARWPAFVERSPRSSVFHSVAWLDALHRTYGYVPIAYTSSPPESHLRGGLVACRIASYITGRRLVSLPFSDHCEPLVEDGEHANALVSALAQRMEAEKLRYLEVRATQCLDPAAGPYHSTESYCFHYVDLRPDLATLFGRCHKSSIQRKILRAEREGLDYETGRSEQLLEAFSRLLVITRRRHRIPPQPKRWFRNLIDCFGEALQIRVAWKGEVPVASILTIRHKDTMVYKYGCSDARFHNLGGTHLLFWKTIEEAKAAGLQLFDLGRTDWDNVGLLQFKDRWGATRSTLTYSRFTISPPAHSSRFAGMESVARMARGVVPYLPSWALRAAGSALYKHIA